MNYYKKAVFAALLCVSTLAVKAQGPTELKVQNPPISVEIAPGDRAINFQMIVNKKLQELPKLGFFGVVDLFPEWGEPKMDDYMVQGNLTYSLIKGIDVVGGFIWNPIDGMRPSAG